MADSPVWSTVPGTQAAPCTPPGTPSGAWGESPAAKQPPKMLVSREVSEEHPATAPSLKTTPHPHRKRKVAVVQCYQRSLVPKTGAQRAGSPTESGSSRSKSAFPRPWSFPTPVVGAGGTTPGSPTESFSSAGPPGDSSISGIATKKDPTDPGSSQPLGTLKSEHCAESWGDGDWLGAPENSPPQPLESERGCCCLQGRAVPSRKEAASVLFSVEAEQRLLRAMGWQEPAGDENFLPLTEEEVWQFLDEVHQLRRQRQQKGCLAHLAAGRSQAKASFEHSTREAESSDTPDDEDWV
ncbi:vasculin-like protein 1 [Echinops telfairi]|uniref:Vasculin-like protein 1 n=1 Tax=Echinops telfairi TaxID=9371 RepID=A0ABM0ZTR9_ECHTE|nr:vasculin-like protein 1 [Echinops telfairi]